jgi:hypothetical protein
VWSEPHYLIGKAKELQAQKAGPPPAVPPAPRGVSLTREGGTLHVSYDSRDWPAGTGQPAALIVTVNSPEDPLPPTGRKLEIDSASGDVDTGIEAHDDWSYDASVSFVDTNGVASADRAVHLDRRT